MNTQVAVKNGDEQAQVMAKISVSLFQDQAGQPGYLVDIQPGLFRPIEVISQVLAALVDYLQSLL